MRLEKPKNAKGKPSIHSESAPVARSSPSSQQLPIHVQPLSSFPPRPSATLAQSSSHSASHQSATESLSHGISSCAAHQSHVPAPSSNPPAPPPTLPYTYQGAYDYVVGNGAVVNHPDTVVEVMPEATGFVLTRRHVAPDSPITIAAQLNVYKAMNYRLWLEGTEIEKGRLTEQKLLALWLAYFSADSKYCVGNPSLCKNGVLSPLSNSSGRSADCTVFGFFKGDRCPDCMRHYRKVKKQEEREEKRGREKEKEEKEEKDEAISKYTPFSKLSDHGRKLRLIQISRILRRQAS